MSIMVGERYHCPEQSGAGICPGGGRRCPDERGPRSGPATTHPDGPGILLPWSSGVPPAGAPRQRPPRRPRVPAHRDHRPQPLGQRTPPPRLLRPNPADQRLQPPDHAHRADPRTHRGGVRHHRPVPASCGTTSGNPSGTTSADPKVRLEPTGNNTLDLTRDRHGAYQEANDDTRWPVNHAFFAKIYIDRGDETGDAQVEDNGPFGDLLARPSQARARHKTTRREKPRSAALTAASGALGSAGRSHVQGWWRRRESNPRPKWSPPGLLRAYPGI